MFRIEISEIISYVFVTRHHAKTHKFLELFQNTVRECDEIFDPPVICNKNKDYVDNITQLVNAKTCNVLFFTMLYQKQKNSSWKGFTPPKVGPVVPRSLIITDDQVILCEEDYGRWPSLGFETAKSPQTPQFLVKSVHVISDVLQIELEQDNSFAVKIVFEEENNGHQETWELLTVAEVEKKKLIQVLAKRWKNLFKLELTIQKKG